MYEAAMIGIRGWGNGWHIQNAIFSPIPDLHLRPASVRRRCAACAPIRDDKMHPSMMMMITIGLITTE